MKTPTHQYDRIVEVVQQQSEQIVPKPIQFRVEEDDYAWYRAHTGKQL